MFSKLDKEIVSNIFEISIEEDYCLPPTQIIMNIEKNSQLGYEHAFLTCRVYGINEDIAIKLLN